MTTDRRIPELGAERERILEFANRYFSEHNAYRNSWLEDVVKWMYYEAGKQWIEPDRDVLLEGVRGYAFRTMAYNDDDGEGYERPTPVTNLVTSAVDVEFATLAKRQWMPKIPNLSRDPRQSAANKVANSILRHRMKKLKWQSLRDRGIRNDIIQGMVIFKSWWDRNWTTTSWFAAKDPHKCQGCGATYASKQIPRPLIDLMDLGGSPNIQDTDDPDNYEMDACPACQGELEPAELTEEESRGKDAFGRPMGSLKPKGNTNLELYTPFEYYPENGGIDQTTDDIRVHGLCKVRSLDWIEEHYPELAGQIEPEDPTELMRWHPTLGNWDIVGRYNSTMDAGIYDCHARVYELIANPCYRLPEGRLIVLIGKLQQLIAEDTALVVKIEDEHGTAQVPLVEIAVATWKEVSGELRGRGIVDDLASPQNRVNGIDSQTVEARERMGSPNLMIPVDSDLQGPEFRAGYGNGKIFRWQPSITFPNAKPEVFGAVTMPSGVVNERDRCIQDMTRIVGPADIEIGEAPRNITTTSGLQILGEQAERRRATRERSITEAFEKVWTHQMNLLWVMRVDEDTYEDELPDGTWEIKQYDRLSIAGQVKVEIEKQAYIDRSIIVREGTREALTDGLYDPSTPTARKRLLEAMGLPTDINDEENLQIEHAKRVWVDFIDEQKIPNVDESIDNPSINYQVLGAFLKQDEGLKIAEESCWPHVLAATAGWEEEYAALVAQDAMVRQTYGGEPDPRAAAMQYAQLRMAYDEAKAGYEQKVQLAKLTPGMDPSMIGMPPQPPPAPIFIPRQKQKRVFLVWQAMLQKDPEWQPYLIQKSMEKMVPLNELVQQVESFLKFRAVVEVYRLLAMPLMAPGSTPGAPGQNVPVGPGAPAPGEGIGPPPPGTQRGGVPTKPLAPTAPAPVTN